MIKQNPNYVPKHTIEAKVSDGVLWMTMTNCHFNRLNENPSATFGIKSVDGKTVHININGVAVIPVTEYNYLKSRRVSIIDVIEDFCDDFITGLMS